MNTAASNQTSPSSPSVANLLNYRGPPPEQTAYPAHLFTCSTFHFDLSTLTMPTKAPNQTSHAASVAIPQFCTLHFHLFTLVPLHLSRTRYICSEAATNRPLFMQNEPNFHRRKNEPNPIYKKGLRKFYTPSDNEKRTQNEPNFRKAKNELKLLFDKGLRQ